MSWDIWLSVEVDGKDVEIVPSVNYTHNTNSMIRAAGFEEWPYRIDGMGCREFCKRLDATLEELRSDPTSFRFMNPGNGWGDYDSLVRVLSEVLDAFDSYPSATVRVSA